MGTESNCKHEAQKRYPEQLPRYEEPPGPSLPIIRITRGDAVCDDSMHHWSYVRSKKIPAVMPATEARRWVLLSTAMDELCQTRRRATRA